MRQAIIPLILVAMTGCSTTEPEQSYAKANSVVASEIGQRIQDIQFQHRTELLDNLMWLAQQGEQAIPFLVPALQHEHPKVRANAAWVLGRIRDRRVIPDLQQAATDPNPTVKLEVARTLVALGDLKYAPALIEGLDSERAAVRYNCHQALKEATNRDFGYDHLTENVEDRQRAVLRWREWWGEQYQDTWFAQSYAQKNGLNEQGKATPAVPPAPMTETAPVQETQPGTTPQQQPGTTPQQQPGTTPQQQPGTEQPQSGSNPQQQPQSNGTPAPDDGITTSGQRRPGDGR